MSISIAGLGSILALKIIDATRDRQIETLKSDVVHARAEQSFRERIAGITIPAELVGDFEVYGFVMRAFDLEDQIFGKGMIRKVLEADPSDEESLVNRLTDGRFGELHASLAFTTENGPQSPDFSDPIWVDGIVERYYAQVFANTNADQNGTVGTVLHFRSKVDEIDSWYDVLKDEDLTSFFQVALGMPSQLSGLDVDMQKRQLEAKFDLATLSDPKVLARLEAKYVAISDVLNPPQSQAVDPIVGLFSSVSTGSQFVPVTMDLPTIQLSASSLYRS